MPSSKVLGNAAHNVIRCNTLYADNLNGFSSGVGVTNAPVKITTDANVVLTPSQVLNGSVQVDFTTLTANREWSFPDAADLVAAIPNVQVGSTFEVMIVNDEKVYYLDINDGVGGNIYGPTSAAPLPRVLEDSVKNFRVRITNVNTGTESYDLYAFS